MADAVKTTMTLGDFIKEATVYEHSKEYFDMVKECGELTLIGMYLDSYDYMKESAEFGEEVPTSVSAMFMEATEEDKDKKDAKVDDAKVGEVKKGFFKRIWAGIVRIFKKILVPFKAIGAFFSKQKNKCDSSIKALSDGIKKTDSNKKPEKSEAKDDKVKSIVSKIENSDSNLYKIIKSGKFSAPIEGTAESLSTLNNAIVVSDKGAAKFVKNMNSLAFSGDVVVPAFVMELYKKLDDIEKILKDFNSGVGGENRTKRLDDVVSKLSPLASIISGFDNEATVLMSREAASKFETRVNEINTICNKINDDIDTMQYVEEVQGNANSALSGILDSLVKFHLAFNDATRKAISIMSDTKHGNGNVMAHTQEIKTLFLTASNA